MELKQTSTHTHIVTLILTVEELGKISTFNATGECLITY